MPGQIGQTILSVIGVIVIIAGAYFTTYLLASKSTKLQQGRTIKILDRFSLSKDKMLCTVEVMGKIYLVAFTNQGAALLDTLDPALYWEAREAARSSFMTDGYRAVQNGFSAIFPSRKRRTADAPDRPETGGRGGYASHAAGGGYTSQTAGGGYTPYAAAERAAPYSAPARGMAGETAGFAPGMANGFASGTENGFAEALKYAREEDDLDAVYRRIQARKARAENTDSPVRRGGNG